MNIGDTPKRLVPYFIHLKTLIKAKKYKEAESYLCSLPINVYDDIVERCDRKGTFAPIWNAIARTQKVKAVENNNSWYIKNQTDSNFIF